MKKIKGFTLIELIVVVGIIGVLIAIVAPSTKGSDQGAKAEQIRSAGNALAKNYLALIKACNQRLVSGGMFPDVASINSVLANGPDADPVFASKYKGCYEESGVGPLNQIIQHDGGGLTVANAQLATAFDGTNKKIGYTFISGDDDLILKVINKYEKLSTIPAAGASTSTYFIYPTAMKSVFGGKLPVSIYPI